jgi:hypothetical protein
MAKTIPSALHHTCFVVRDIEQVAQKMADDLGIGPWNIWTIEPTVCRVRGKDQPYGFRVALATVGGGTYELITPHGGESVYDEHLQRQGQGFHHTCLAYPTLEAQREAKAELLQQGRELIQEGAAEGIFEFGYFLFPEIASAVELMYLDPAKLPPPEKVVVPA